jgi:hypothetical protein
MTRTERSAAFARKIIGAIPISAALALLQILSLKCFDAEFGLVVKIVFLTVFLIVASRGGGVSCLVVLSSSALAQRSASGALDALFALMIFFVTFFWRKTEDRIIGVADAAILHTVMMFFWAYSMDPATMWIGLFSKLICFIFAGELAWIAALRLWPLGRDMAPGSVMRLIEGRCFLFEKRKAESASFEAAPPYVLAPAASAAAAYSVIDSQQLEKALKDMKARQIEKYMRSRQSQANDG